MSYKLRVLNKIANFTFPSTKLLIRYLQMTGQRRSSICDTTQLDRVTNVVTVTDKAVILGVSNDASLTYHTLVAVIRIRAR